MWEILQPGEPDYCCGVLLRRRHPVTNRVLWCYWDGTCEQREDRLGYAVWDCAFYSQQGGLSSTGWRRQRYPNPLSSEFVGTVSLAAIRTRISASDVGR